MTEVYLDLQKIDGTPRSETKVEFESRRALILFSSSALITQMYQEYNKYLQNSMDKNTQFGLASFLAADFNQTKKTDDGYTYFDAVMRDFKKLIPPYRM